MSRLLVVFAALGLVVGAACTTPQHRANYPQTTADQPPSEPTTPAPDATGPGASDQTAAVVAGNDPTPVLTHVERTAATGVAARPALATAAAPSSAPAVGSGGPHPVPVSTRG